jgi:broad specificity phosphatase PhoE
MEHMSDILFIRHAETDMSGKFCGHSDPELNARGYAQLDALVSALRPENISAVYTSDLRRAQSTAHAIASAFSVECHVKPALREIYFGRWEGLAWKEIEQLDHTYTRRWLDEYPDLPAPEGETLCDFERRVLDEVRSLATMKRERPIAVVTHAGVLRLILRKLCGCSDADAWEQTKGYGSIIRYVCPVASARESVEVEL